MNSTSWAFINDRDVLAIDSEGSPASAQALLAGIATVTDKPVKYLVVTHFHLDHAYGNSGLPPTVQVIGHEFSRRMLLGPEARQGTTIRNFVDPMPGRIADLKKQVDAETDAAKKATLREQLASAEATLKVYSGDFPLTPPSVTITRDMSLWSGDKEFQIKWIGRAPTAGDVIVDVPSEKAAATGGSNCKAMVGWQGDAFANEHPETIEALRPLNLELLLPGHGDHIQGNANINTAITNMQGYLREEWRQVSEAKQRGLTPEDALKGLDMSRFRDAYGNGVTPSLPAVRRIYDVIDKKAQL
jgi:glyoxylase-like metal-dependent hydrolase (beta-lactamase superfamily II)